MFSATSFPSDPLASTPSASDLETIRNDLVKASENKPNLSPEVRNLIQRIGQEAPSERINAIIFRLNEGNYLHMSLSRFLLKTHLNEAGLTQIAEELSERIFPDSALSPARGGLRERDLRIHDTLGPEESSGPYADLFF